jgi:hypothetical protein
MASTAARFKPVTYKPQFSLRILFGLTFVFSVAFAIYSLLHDVALVRWSVHFMFLFWLSYLVSVADDLFPRRKFDLTIRDFVVAFFFLGVPCAYGLWILYLNGLAMFGVAVIAWLCGLVFWAISAIVVFTFDNSTADSMRR